MNNEKGFSLIELMVVLVILGLLASYVGVKYFGVEDRSKVSNTKIQMKGISDALTMYRADTGSYPSTEFGLKALMNNVENKKKLEWPIS